MSVKITNTEQTSWMGLLYCCRIVQLCNINDVWNKVVSFCIKHINIKLLHSWYNGK